jgi:ribonuclease P protein component
VLPTTSRLPLRQFRDQTQKNGHIFSDPLFSLIVAPASSQPSRFAIVISKKISSLAVVRNKKKRQLLHAISSVLPQLNPGYDVIILAKKALLDADYSIIVSHLHRLLKQSHLL